jgi:Protein of unknown function (DUF3168)
MTASPVLLMMTLLREDEGVTARVSGRIYAQVAPQLKGQPSAVPAAPFVVLRLVSRSEEQTLEGPSGVADARVVVISCAPTYADADQVAEAVMSMIRSRGERVVDGRRARLSLQGVNTSDFLSDQQIFRRAVEVRLFIQE